MIQIHSLDVVVTDVMLGGVALACSIQIPRHHRLASLVFTMAGISAWLGAISHATADATSPLGRLLWLLTLISLAASSIALATFSRKRSPQGLTLALLLIYAIFALFDDDFVWVAVLQTAASAAYGITLFIQNASTQIVASVKNYIAYVAITMASAFITMPALSLALPINPLAIFHLIEIPAVVFLYLSVRGFVLANDPK